MCSIGNRVAKELICMTHGHKQWRRIAEGVGVAGWKGAKWEKSGQL